MRRERQLVNQARTAGITRDAISTSKPKLNAAVKRWEAREAARVDQARTAGVTQDAISTITPGSKPSSSDEARAAARVDQAKTTGVRRDVISTSTPTARGDRQAVRRERQLVNQARTAGITRDAISTRAPKLNAAVKRWEAREAARVDQPSEDGWRHARCDQHDHAQAQGHRRAMKREQQHELTKRGQLASREMRSARAHLQLKATVKR